MSKKIDLVAFHHEVPVPGIKHESSSSMGRQPKHAHLDFKDGAVGVTVASGGQSVLVPWGNVRYVAYLEDAPASTAAPTKGASK